MFPTEPERRPPPFWVAMAATVAMVAAMAWLRIQIYPDRIVPLTYVLPLLMVLWHRDKRMLWGMSSCFMFMAYLKVAVLIPDSYFDDRLQQFLFFVMQWGNILVAGGVLHMVLVYRERLEHGNARLASSNAELAAREEEIAQQNEELQTQAEELEQQTEELRAQTDELQSLNADLADREQTLQQLLRLSSSDAEEKAIWDVACAIALATLGERAQAAAMLELRDGIFEVRASAGIDGSPLASGPLPAAETLAALVVERNQTAQLEDAALRPDIRLPGGGDCFRSALSAPVRFFGRPIGVLETYSARPQPWTSYQAQRLSWLANQTSLVLGAARLRLELKQARKAAEEANEAKGRFLANVSHELRTPMGAILGMIDLALDDADFGAETRDHLQIARSSADLLLMLLNELLDFSRIEAGKLTLETGDFNLRDAVTETARMLAVRAEQQGLTLHCRVADDLPEFLVGDHLRLRQVLTNLVGNAIKFTPQGEVAIEAVARERRENEVCLGIAVRDTGIGISPEDQRKIFAPFAQADTSTTRRYGGTGLGLAIAAHLVRLMGGTLAVDSQPGLGSTFRFNVWLPLGNAPAPAKSSSESPDQPPARPLQILLAEDTPANQKLIQTILTRRGHAIEVAGDGLQAHDLARQRDFDLVLMDVQMPGMDGFETTAAIRGLTDRARATVPIVAMTAHAMKGDEQRCLQAGMDGYLSKPIDAAALVALVERLGRRAP